MGKLSDGMPKKPSKKDITWSKLKLKLGTNCSSHEDYMKVELEKRWKTSISYSCKHCLKEAFENHGYVSDDELIESSKGRLKHK